MVSFHFPELAGYLRPIDQMLETVRVDKEQYVGPALTKPASVCIPVLREVISPASFRNAEAEITDVEAAGVRRVRAVANKFKYGERKRGLQILRMMGAGGRKPQNRSDFTAAEKPGEVFDLNTLIFGDSANRGAAVLPVKAAAQYSDALSVAPYADCVGESFHISSFEDGSLFDPEAKRNTSNIFSRHFVKPGTLMLQTICINGMTAPQEGIGHLLLAIGLAGAYGGATSIYGVNVRNHVVGVYAGRFERDVASPYEALRAADLDPEVTVDEALDGFDKIYRRAYPLAIGRAPVREHLRMLVARFEDDDAALREAYGRTSASIATYFNEWFGFGDAKKATRGKQP